MTEVRVLAAEAKRSFTERVDAMLRVVAAAAAEATVLELEVRLGEMRAHGSGARTRDTSAARFESSVNAWLFYAHFQALASRADVRVAPRIVRSRHTSYESAPRYRLEHALDAASAGADAANDRWLLKMPYASYNELVSCLEARAWFDVRLALAEERVCPAPPLAVRADTSARPHVRTRERRAMFFATAPAWRLDWTRVTSAHEVRAHFEIEIEYTGTGYEPDATRQLVLILDALTMALGPTSKSAPACTDAPRRRMSSSGELLVRALAVVFLAGHAFGLVALLTYAAVSWRQHMPDSGQRAYKREDDGTYAL